MNKELYAMFFRCIMFFRLIEGAHLVLSPPPFLFGSKGPDMKSGPFSLSGSVGFLDPSGVHHGSGSTGSVEKRPGPVKTNAVVTIGKSLVMRIEPNTVEGALGKSSETKKAVWL